MNDEENQLMLLFLGSQLAFVIINYYYLCHTHDPLGTMDMLIFPAT